MTPKKIQVSKTKALKSQTEWRRLGYRVKKGEVPAGSVHVYRRGKYDTYGDWQVERFKRPTKKPPCEVPILEALFTLNRRAKRCRNRARNAYASGRKGEAANMRDEKEAIYELKGQALHYLVADGTLKVTGIHRFEDDNFAEVLEGHGYCFHRPCERPQIDHESVSMIGEIEKKPQGAKEPRLIDARYTVEIYLRDKEHVDVYSWLPRIRSTYFYEQVVNNEDEDYAYIDACDGNI